MRILSLNLWCGKKFNLLMQFLARMADNGVDVFCFQEVLHTTSERTETNGCRANLLDELCLVLHGYQPPLYLPAQEGFDMYGAVDFPMTTGNAIFVREGVRVNRSGGRFVYGQKNWLPRNAKFEAGAGIYVPRVVPFVQVQNPRTGNEFSIFNFHGLWNGQGKGDTPDRIEQSKNVKRLMVDETPYCGTKILIGDFNLLPNTESIRILEEGMWNLNDVYGVNSTRSSFYPKEKPQQADYALVSGTICICDYEAMPDEVSDHLPLLLTVDDDNT